MIERMLTAKHLGQAFDNGQVRVLDASKMQNRRRGLLIQAHPDDGALGEGLPETLVAENVSIDALTFTDGGARDLKGIPPELLIPIRAEEDFKGFGISGFALGAHVGLPDGALEQNSEQAIEAVQGLVVARDYEFVVVTNALDEHPDHAHAAEIAMAAVDGEIPVYMMDTVTREDRDGKHLQPTHAFNVTLLNKWKRDRAYRAHRSQTTNLPENEMADVRRVIQLPNERGKEQGLRRVGVLFHSRNNTHDPVSHYLEKKRVN